MANTSKINGFRVVKHLNGSPYNGQANIYYVASAGDEMFVGDVVKLAGSADANGIATVDLAAATDIPVGVIIGIMHSKFDPNGKMNSGSTALDSGATTPGIAVSGAAYVLVADSPDIVIEGEVNTAGTAWAATDIGSNMKHALGTRTTTTSVSPLAFDSAVAPTTTSTFMYQLLGFVKAPNNEIGASARVLARFNVHQYGSLGTTGL